MTIVRPIVGRVPSLPTQSSPFRSPQPRWTRSAVLLLAKEPVMRCGAKTEAIDVGSETRMSQEPAQKTHLTL